MAYMLLFYTCVVHYDGGGADFAQWIFPLLADAPGNR